MHPFVRAKHYASLHMASALAAALLLTACSQSGQQAAPEGTAPSAGTRVSVSDSSAFAAFDGTIPANITNTQCSLDIINGGPAGNVGPTATGSTVTFGGWAGNGKAQAANGFELVLRSDRNAYSAPLTTGVVRADVAKAWNSEGMTKSGYNLAAALTGVTAGTYSLYVADPADSTSDCDLHRTLIVQ